jgi:hypothetical protein
MNIHISWDVTDMLEKCSATTSRVKWSEKTRKMEKLHPFNIPFNTAKRLRRLGTRSNTAVKTGNLT